VQIYFIRHAQSINNAVWDDDSHQKINRKADPELTETGLIQARLTAEFLSQTHPEIGLRWVDPQNTRGFGLTHLYCSLMERAVQTGSIIANRLGLPLQGMIDLHEVGGIYLAELDGDEEIIHILHGHNRSYFMEHYPNLVIPVSVDGQGWWQGGREPREERLQRAQRILDFLNGRHGATGDRVGVIIHGGIYHYIFGTLFRIDQPNPDDLDLPYRIIINNCSITRYDFEEEKFILMYQNRVDHLPVEMIT